MGHWKSNDSGAIYEAPKPSKYRPHGGEKERRKACKRLGIAYRGIPRIYCFMDEDNQAFAMAQDGTVLAVRPVKSEGDVCTALGAVPGFAPHLHETYRKHYPDGYDMEFVLQAGMQQHAKLYEAVKLNKEANHVDADTAA